MLFKKENIINNFFFIKLLTINFDKLEENIYLKDIININDINDSILIEYLNNNDILNNFMIDKIFNYNKNSKCFILKNLLNKNEIYIYSVTNDSDNIIENFLKNLNRLKIKSQDLSCLDKDNCLLMNGVYQELFENNTFKLIKEYIKTLSSDMIINIVGYSINGCSSILLSYLLTYVCNNTINVYSYATPKFCNIDLINEINKKSNINLLIINNKFDPFQLVLPNFTLNFENVLIYRKNIKYFSKHNIDNIINSNFRNNFIYYSYNNHIISECLKSLIKSFENFKK